MEQIYFVNFIFLMLITDFCESTCKDKFRVNPDHSACLERSKLATTGQMDHSAVLTAHNSRRSTASSTYKATDIMTMILDTEVAMVAQKWADNCQLNHDKNSNRMIPGRFTVGQNIAQSPTAMTWDSVVQLWFSEKKDFKYGGQNTFQSVGHFTQVVWAESYMLGCGYSKCGATHFYVCNYAPAGNSPSSRINKPFQTSGSACKSKVNNLCDCSSTKCDGNAILNHTTCQCQCDQNAKFLTGPNCQYLFKYYVRIGINMSIRVDLWLQGPNNNGYLSCTNVKESTFCGSFYTVDSCHSQSNVPFMCPSLCKVCPYAGANYTEGSQSVSQIKNHDNNAHRPGQCPQLFLILILLQNFAYF